MNKVLTYVTWTQNNYEFSIKNKVIANPFIQLKRKKKNHFLFLPDPPQIIKPPDLLKRNILGVQLVLVLIEVSK